MEGKCRRLEYPTRIECQVGMTAISSLQLGPFEPTIYWME